MASKRTCCRAHTAQILGHAIYPYCAGGVWFWPMFSLVRALPSTTSAEACASLFGGFIGTTARSDPSPAYTSGVRLGPSRTGPRLLGTPKRSPGSRACSFSACLGSPTTRDHPPARATVGACVAFPLRKQCRHPELWFSQLDTLPTDSSVYASTAA